MDETRYHLLADSYLSTIEAVLEETDARGGLDMECQNGILTITLPDERQLVVSKHAPTKQIWLSSPVSGGLHFPYDEASGQWKLSDGRTLSNVLAQELHALASVEVRL